MASEEVLTGGEKSPLPDTPKGTQPERGFPEVLPSLIVRLTPSDGTTPNLNDFGAEHTLDLQVGFQVLAVPGATWGALAVRLRY